MLVDRLVDLVRSCQVLAWFLALRFALRSLRLENRVQNQTNCAKMLNNDTWERLAEQVGKGLPQDPQIWGAPMLF